MISNKILKQHINHVCKNLSLLNNADASLKLKKRNFFTDTITYLDHVISPTRLELASHTISNMCGLDPPTVLTELRSFPGL